MVWASCNKIPSGTAPALVAVLRMVTLQDVESQEAEVSQKAIALEQKRLWARFMTGVATRTAHGGSFLTRTVTPVKQRGIFAAMQR